MDERDWHARREAHHRRVDAAVAAHLERSRRGTEHPVEDFLFTYYRIRPAVLRRWHPGLGVVLVGDPRGLDDPTGYLTTPQGTTLDPVAGFGHRRDGVAWVRRLLRSTSGRPPSYGCFGLHEWAMVHGLEQHQVRHPDLPLRLAPRAIADVVDRGVRCSHFDAYRFFTPSARALNVLPLTPTDRIDHDQPGCLHVGMDLHKWAGKLSPAVPSELVMDCFDLARDIRRVDMRASPYDTTGLGLRPIPVETAAGRADYVAEQRRFTARAEPLRAALLTVADALCAALDVEPGDAAEPARGRVVRTAASTPERRGLSSTA